MNRIITYQCMLRNKYASLLLSLFCFAHLANAGTIGNNSIPLITETLHQKCMRDVDKHTQHIQNRLYFAKNLQLEHLSKPVKGLETAIKLLDKISPSYTLVLDPNFTSTLQNTDPCTNSFTITSILNPSDPNQEVRYFADSNLTNRITTGYTGHGDTTYNLTTVAGTSNVLTISNLSQNVYIYAGRYTTAGVLLTNMSEILQIPVNRSNPFVGMTTQPLVGCGSVNLFDALPSSVTQATTIVFRNPAGAIISNEDAFSVTTGGNYSVTATVNGCTPVMSTINVTVNPVLTLNVENQELLVGLGESVSIIANANGASISYVDNTTGTVLGSNTVGPFNTVGTKSYTVKATNGPCTISKQVLVTVFDRNSCPINTKRVYASTARLIGVGSNINNAVDGNPATFATISSVVGILGLGTSWIDLKFATEVPAGTPVTVKVGKEYSGINLLGGASIGAFKTNAYGTNLPFGSLQPIDNSIITVLGGTNQYEITFVPKNLNTNATYDGVRIQIGGVVTVADNLNVYGAYYNVPDAANANCNAADIYDLLSGVNTYGVSVASLTVGVDTPQHLLDSDETNYARMYGGVSVAAASYITTVFKNQSLPNDLIEIKLRNPNGILDVNLLTGLFLTKYQGSTRVGERTALNGNILGLTLLSGNDTGIVTVNIPSDAAFDRVTLEMGGVLNVASFLDIYYIKRKPNLKLNGLDINDLTVCKGTVLSITNTNCYTYKWYSTETGGTSLADSNQFTIPNTAVIGNNSYFVQAYLNGCPVGSRFEMKAKVIDQPTASSITSANVVADCSNAGTITVSSAYPNALYKFYANSDMTQQITTGFTNHAGVAYTVTNNTLSVANLDRNRTYYVSMILPGTSCTNSAGNLKAVNINMAPRPVLTVLNNIENCVNINLYDAITNYNPALTYKFYAQDGTEIDAANARSIDVTGTFYIEVVDPAFTCSSVRMPVSVTILPTHNFMVPTRQYVVNIGQTATLQATSDGQLTYFDVTNNRALVSNVVGPFTTEGNYSYIVTSTYNGCVQKQTIVVTVVDPTRCYPASNKVRPNSIVRRNAVMGLLGTVTNEDMMIDNDPNTYGTFTNVINALGLGNVWVDITFNTPVPAGTPIKLKIGNGFDVVNLISGFGVSASNTATRQTTAMTFMDGEVLGLLAGDNVREFTFLAQSNGVNIPVNKVRVMLGGLVSVAQTAKLYDVYYETPTTTPVCATNDISDVYYGVKDIGIAVANSLTTVTNPLFAMDNLDDSYALLSNGVSVLSGSYITTKFSTVSNTTDVVKVKLGSNGRVITANVLSGISIQKKLGDANVGAPYILTADFIRLELLNGNQDLIYTLNRAEGNFDRVEINTGGVVDALSALRVYYVKRYPKIVFENLDLNNLTVCDGTILNLQGDPCSTYEWYTSASATTPIYTGISYQIPSTLAAADYTYYIKTKRNGCYVMQPFEFRFTKVTIPTADDIPVAASIAVDCLGNLTIAPTAPFPNVIFRYFTSQDKTEEILTGFTQHAGVSYTVENNRLTAENVTQPRSYFISMEYAGTTCSNIVGDLKEVSVTVPTRPNAIVSPNLINCNSVNLYDAITNFNPIWTYTFYNADGAQLTEDQARAINANGVYSVIVSNSTSQCETLPQYINVNIIPSHRFDVPNLDYVLGLNEATFLQATSDGTLSFYDVTNNRPLTDGNVGPFTSPGLYVYTITSTSGNCVQVKTVTVRVVDFDNCLPFQQKIRPTAFSVRNAVGGILGVTTNGENAIDGNPETYASLTNVADLLGLGRTWLNVKFSQPVPAGKPIKIKVGTGFGVLNVISDFTVRGFNGELTNMNLVGQPQAVNVELIGLVSGRNVYEFTFVPQQNNSSISVDGVRIFLGGLISVAQTARVYDVYYEVDAPSGLCPTNNISDVYSGVVDLGLGVLNSLTTVTDAFNVADANVNSYATLSAAVNVASAAQLTARFSTISNSTDKVKVIFSKSGSLLDASVLGGAQIQKKLGDVNVGAPVLFNNNILEVNLLNGRTDVYELTLATDAGAFDRVEIRLGGLVNVLNTLNIHQITRQASIEFIDQDINNIIVCANGQLALEPQACTTFNWINADGTIVTSNSNTFTVPAIMPAGVYNYSIQPMRNGCEVGASIPFTFTVRGIVSSPELIVTTNPQGPIICGDSVVITAALGNGVIATNPIFEWYDANGVLVPNQTSNTLSLSGLAPGTYSYTVGVRSDENCSTPEADRSAVSFEIQPVVTTADIVLTSTATEVCVGENITITASSTLTNPVFYWYSDAAGTQPIITGTTPEATYVLNGNTLVISNVSNTLSVPVYVTVTADGVCADPTAMANINVEFIGTFPPVLTTPGVQSFCKSDNPTLASLMFNNIDVMFFDQLTGGTLLSLDTPLVDGGVYYAVLMNQNCESDRLEVEVELINPTMVTAEAQQEFCNVSNPTVADLVATGQNVVWYSDAALQTELPLTTALTQGGVYYAANVIGTCKSEGFAVTVNLTDPQGITAEPQQTFCQANNPTVADIVATPLNINWYDAETNGNLLDPTTALVDGANYYGFIFTPGCATNQAFVVTITLNPGGDNTTIPAAQTFCISENATVANLDAAGVTAIWYSTPIGGTPLVDSQLLADGMYYAATLSPEGCESFTRKEVTVSIIDVSTPTGDTVQEFCKSSNPTIASLVVSGSNIVWKDGENGTVLNSDTRLVNGMTYYAYGSTTSGCLSVGYLAVVVNLLEEATPTTTSTTQYFCEADNATIADLQVNEPNIVWYDAAENGNVLPTTTVLADGVRYYATITNPATGCESGTRLEIKVLFNDFITYEITGLTDQICYGTTVTYSIPSGLTSYSWTVVGGTVLGATTTNSIDVKWNTEGTGSISVVYEDPNNRCRPSFTTTVAVEVENCSDLSITKVVDNATPSINDVVVFTVTVTNTGQSNYDNIVVNEQIPSGYTYVSSVASQGTYNNLTGIWNIDNMAANSVATLSLSVKVLPTGNHLNTASIVTTVPRDTDPSNNEASAETVPNCLVVYNEFTPNGDGQNDFLIISCLENYPNNELKVYNRYGSLVYSKKGYQNDWTGIANVNGTFNGSQLPSGTYYYTLDLGDDTIKVKTGWLYIMR